MQIKKIIFSIGRRMSEDNSIMYYYGQLTNIHGEYETGTVVRVFKTMTKKYADQLNDTNKCDYNVEGGNNTLFDNKDELIECANKVYDRIGENLPFETLYNY